MVLSESAGHETLHVSQASRRFYRLFGNLFTTEADHCEGVCLGLILTRVRAPPEEQD